MRIIGAMLARNEEWVLKASIPCALEWVDELVFLDDNSTDLTPDIAQSFDRVHYHKLPEKTEFWNEMDSREYLKELVMPYSPTHFGLIDADEMIPIPFRKQIRTICDRMKPDRVLAPSALNPWNSLDVIRVDRCQWTTNFWTACIKIGKVPLIWKAKSDGYTHHNRVPPGIDMDRISGPSIGVIHLQFANLPRRLWKHFWYKQTELIRWGNIRKESQPQHLNKKYGAAFDESGLKLAPTPATWFREIEKENIDISSPGWYKEECEKLLDKYGKDFFKGLELWYND